MAGRDVFAMLLVPTLVILLELHRKRLQALTMCVPAEMLDQELPQTSALGIEADRDQAPDAPVSSRWLHGEPCKARLRLQLTLHCEQGTLVARKTLSLTTCARNSDAQPYASVAHCYR